MILLNSTDNFVLSQVADLHIRNISQGFLSTLGKDFMFCVYKSISLSPNSFLAVFTDRHRVVGFISGTTNLQEIKSIMRKKCKFLLFKTIMNLLLDPRKLRQFFETKSYSERVDEIEAELLSIAVDLNYRGKGIAEKLYLELCKYFYSRGVKRFKIVVGENLKEAQRFYEKRGAIKQKEIELHKGLKSYIYVQEVSKCLEEMSLRRS